MRTFEIPGILYKEFGECGRLKTAVPGYPDAVILWGEEYPTTHLRIFLDGEIAHRNRDTPDMHIISSGVGAPWIRTNLEIMGTEPFASMVKRLGQLYEQSEDYTHHRRIPK